MKALSIRWRLTLWYGLTLAGLLVAMGGIVYVALSQRLMARTDNELDEELVELTLEVRLATNSAELQRQLEDRFSRHESFDFQVLDASGFPFFLSQRLREQPLGNMSQRPHAEESTRAIEAHRVLGDLRVANRTVQALNREFLLQSVARLANDRRELADYAQMMLIVGPLGLVGALSIGYLLAWKALAPVDQMAAVAERITGSQLAERIRPAQPDDELGRLARTLNRMLDRLQEAVEELRRFTADAAHELRTPLTVLRTEVEVALRSRRTPEKYEGTLEVMLAEIDRLARLTNQLLLLSRHDAGWDGASREPVELRPLLQDVCDQLQTLAANRCVMLNLQSHAAPVVAGEDLQFGQLFYNLIENGLKYTPAGGSVSVILRTEGHDAEVQIVDTGIGIPPEHLAHLGRRFYRVDASRNRDAGGAGLGLSICQAIVTANAGSLDIQSSNGAGTTVIVRVPCFFSDAASDEHDALGLGVDSAVNDIPVEVSTTGTPL